MRVWVLGSFLCAAGCAAGCVQGAEPAPDPAPLVCPDGVDGCGRRPDGFVIETAPQPTTSDILIIPSTPTGFTDDSCVIRVAEPPRPNPKHDDHGKGR